MSSDRRGTHSVKLAFEPDTIDLAIEQLVPLKVLRPGAKESKKYAQIRGSIKAIGLVEAPVVARNLDDAAKFFLLDGHMRIEALKDLSIERVECLVSTDDETYTYNKRINRLAAVQEHSMIKRAIARGVPEAAIAEALGLDIKTIFRRTRLLNGICPEAVAVLKDTSAPMAVFDILRRMGPIRQVEAAELMAGQNNYSVQFAKALLAATPDAALAVPRRKPPKRDGQVSTEQMAKMERELASLQTQVKSFEETYGVDTLHLTVARGYKGEKFLCHQGFQVSALDRHSRRCWPPHYAEHREFSPAPASKWPKVKSSARSAIRKPYRAKCQPETRAVLGGYFACNFKSLEANAPHRSRKTRHNT